MALGLNSRNCGVRPTNPHSLLVHNGKFWRSNPIQASSCSRILHRPRTSLVTDSAEPWLLRIRSLETRLRLHELQQSKQCLLILLGNGTVPFVAMKLPRA